MSKAKKPRKPPPAPDDPRYKRTCTRCYHVRNWTVPYCPRCGNPEFSLPETEPRPTSQP